MNALLAVVFSLSTLGGVGAPGVVTPLGLATIVPDPAHNQERPDMPSKQVAPRTKRRPEPQSTRPARRRVLRPRDLRTLLPALMAHTKVEPAMPTHEPGTMRDQGSAAVKEAPKRVGPNDSARRRTPDSAVPGPAIGTEEEPFGVGSTATAPPPRLPETRKSWVPERTLPRIQPPMLTRPAPGGTQGFWYFGP